MGAIPPSPVGFASGLRGGIAPNLSELRRHWQVRPRQTHGIVPLLLGKLEAYSLLGTTHCPVRSTQETIKSFYSLLGTTHCPVRIP